MEFKLGSNHARPAPDGAQRRKGERLECNLSCRASTSHGEIGCRIDNISVGGIGIFIDHLSKITVGDKIRIISGPLAGTSGVVRWKSVPKYGLEFDLSTSSSALVRSFMETMQRS